MDIGHDQKGDTRIFLGNNPEQILVVANTGYGKSLAVSSMAERYQEDGWTVIYLGDGGKGEEEIFYSNFLPIERYHLDFLNKIGKPIKTIPCKAYHAFTFNLPKHKISPYQIYTIGIKDLTRRELSMLAEVQSDTDSIRYLQEAIVNIPKTAGFYHLLHEIQSLIKPAKNSSGEIKPTDDNFYIKTGSSSAKNMSDIIGLFKPFRHDYFLAEQNCKYNLNWKEILNDNKSIHFFSTKYIQDPKMQHFVILSALNQIIMHKDLAKKPVLIVIPEARKLMGSDSNVGYKRFLAEACKECLSIMRSMGQGFASIMDSQNYSDLDSGVRDSYTKIFLGRLSVSDIDRLSKVFLFDRSTKENLSSPEKPNTFFLLDKMDYGAFHLLLPSFRHAEVRYDIDKTFEEEEPELMQNYTDLIKEMQIKLDNESSFFRERTERESEAIKLREKRDKEQNKTTKPSEDDKIKEIKEKQKNSDMQKAYNLRKDGMKLEKIGETLGISKDTALRWINKFEKINKNSESIDPKQFKGEGVLPEELGIETESREIANPIIEESSSEIQYRKVHAKNVEDEYNMQIATEGEDAVDKIESMSSVNNFKPKDVKPIDLEFDYLEDVDKSEDSEDV